MPVLIRQRFSRFIHGVILKEINEIPLLYVREFNMRIYPTYMSLDSLKDLLKIIDLEYPRDKELMPLSYTKLGNYDFLKHIAFIEMLLAENGYEPKYLERLNDENV